MALSGSEIVEFLPRIDCQKCGFSRCSSFAMEVAQNQASLDLCQKMSEASRKALSEEYAQTGTGPTDISQDGSQQRRASGEATCIF